jgi:hypothetical protein
VLSIFFVECAKIWFLTFGTVSSLDGRCPSLRTRGRSFEAARSKMRGACVGRASFYNVEPEGRFFLSIFLSANGHGISLKIHTNISICIENLQKPKNG